MPGDVIYAFPGRPPARGAGGPDHDEADRLSAAAARLRELAQTRLTQARGLSAAAAELEAMARARRGDDGPETGPRTGPSGGRRRGAEPNR